MKTIENIQKEIDIQNQRKGEIISLVVSLEEDLEFLISNYFAEDSGRNIVFAYSILSDIPVEKKKQYLFEIIKFEEGETFGEFNFETKQLISSLRKDIDFIIQKRNAIAHWHGSISNEKILIENKKRVTTPKDRLEITSELLEEIKLKKEKVSKILNKLHFKYKKIT